MSYIRNSVKATVDAYDGTVTLYAQDETDPVLQAWMKVFPGTVKPKSDISPQLAEHLRYPEDLFKVQRKLLAKYHVNDPVTFFSTSDFWDVPLDPNPTASSFQPPYYIVAKDLAANDSSASFQLTSAMNRFRRDFLAAYISASSDPATYGKITVLTIPGQVNGPKLANNAITTDTAVSQDLGVIGRDNQNRIRWGNLLTLPVRQGGLLYVEPVYASPGASDAASSYPRLIRVAMMYNDRIGYGPTVSDALTELFGPGAGARPPPVRRRATSPTRHRPQHQPASSERQRPSGAAGRGRAKAIGGTYPGARVRRVPVRRSCRRARAQPSRSVNSGHSTGYDAAKAARGILIAARCVAPAPRRPNPQERRRQGNLWSHGVAHPIWKPAAPPVTLTFTRRGVEQLGSSLGS